MTPVFYFENTVSLRKCFDPEMKGEDVNVSSFSTPNLCQRDINFSLK